MQHFKFMNWRIGKLKNSFFDVTNRLYDLFLAIYQDKTQDIGIKTGIQLHCLILCKFNLCWLLVFRIKLSLLSTLLTLHMNSTYLALKHIEGHACTSLIWTDICGIAAGKSCEKILQHSNCRRWIGARVQYSYLNLTREIDPSKLQTIELIMLWIYRLYQSNVIVQVAFFQRKSEIWQRSLQLYFIFRIHRAYRFFLELHFHFSLE